MSTRSGRFGPQANLLAVTAMEREIDLLRLCGFDNRLDPALLRHVRPLGSAGPARPVFRFVKTMKPPESGKYAAGSGKDTARLGAILETIPQRYFKLSETDRGNQAPVVRFVAMHRPTIGIETGWIGIGAMTGPFRMTDASIAQSGEAESR